MSYLLQSIYYIPSINANKILHYSTNGIVLVWHYGIIDIHLHSIDYLCLNIHYEKLFDGLHVYIW